MLALSTAWNADRSQDGRAIIKEIHGLGIKHIEMNFSLTGPMVKEILAFCSRNGITVASLHNYCPIPDGLPRSQALPDCFSLSSVNEDERKKAVECTKATIATARKASAKAVVLHTGRVEMEDKTRQLIDLYNRGRKDSPQYQETLEAFGTQRKDRAEPYLSQLIKSLKELADCAQEAGILLGIENRFYYREIPTPEEFGIIFEELDNKTLGYWHDVGHAFIHEKLGFIQEGILLKNFGSRLLGVHLHNVRDLCDHRAPFDGDFDLGQLKGYLKADTLKVLEVHAQVTSQEVKDSFAYLEGMFP